MYKFLDLASHSSRVSKRALTPLSLMLYLSKELQKFYTCLAGLNNFRELNVELHYFVLFNNGHIVM